MGGSEREGKNRRRRNSGLVQQKKGKKEGEREWRNEKTEWEGVGEGVKKKNIKKLWRVEVWTVEGVGN